MSDEAHSIDGRQLLEPTGQGIDRRAFLGLLGVGALGFAGGGCVPRVAARVGREQRLITAAESRLPIVQWNRARPDPTSVLRQNCRPTRTGSARYPALGSRALRRLDELMRATLRTARGVGLAAPQVDVLRRVILVKRQDGSGDVITAVDPIVRARSPLPVDGYEACLSIRGVGGLVRRPTWIALDYYDVKGKRHRYRVEGWEARIFYHELDHLDGRLYLDPGRLVGPLLPIDEVRRRRRRAAPRPAPPRAHLSRRDGPWIL